MVSGSPTPVASTFPSAPLARSFRNKALAPRIRVNAIGPGPTLPSARQTTAEFERQCAAMPLGRGTTPEEICRAVRFILDAPAMTGQMIALDGGQHLGPAPAREIFP